MPYLVARVEDVKDARKLHLRKTYFSPFLGCHVIAPSGVGATDE